MGVPALPRQMWKEDSIEFVKTPKTMLDCSFGLALAAEHNALRSPAQCLSMPLLDSKRQGEMD